MKKMDKKTTSYPYVSLGGKKSNEKGEGDSGKMSLAKGTKVKAQEELSNGIRKLRPNNEPESLSLL
ncbi:hypothetical protein AA0X95_19940 [Bacillus sp. 1P10SD]|uniref:hypothetical protein n=1 Tax=Bacillus sp. 1P10SD TaxID=3132265 RepID=UPI0039A5D07A